MKRPFRKRQHQGERFRTVRKIRDEHGNIIDREVESRFSYVSNLTGRSIYR
jgi:hypothetical protein